MNTVIEITNLNKTYEDGFRALKNINLNISKGEIFALLGPNGAGKTTLINSVCGLVKPSSGQIKVDGFDNISDYRKARERVGLVPQELTTDAFETVMNTVSFSRSLFGKPANKKVIEEILKSLSLWDKKDNKLITLSGGMKRRVMIAKALSHEPSILFLDEPTAGVDVELRKGMWQLVHKLRGLGVTIILTTHYIEEAEEMSDRVGVISDGEILVTEDKKTLMRKLGKKELQLDLKNDLKEIPDSLKAFNIELKNEGKTLTYTYNTSTEVGSEVSELLLQLSKAGVAYTDLQTKQSSLEDIFVELVNK